MKCKINEQQNEITSNQWTAKWNYVIANELRDWTLTWNL